MNVLGPRLPLIRTMRSGSPPGTREAPSGLRRVCKTLGMTAGVAAMVGLPAELGKLGGWVGVVGSALLATGACMSSSSDHDRKTALKIFVPAAVVISAIGALGGTTGVIVMTGLGALLGLAGDGINRGTRPGY